jgi:hypothetical protein
MHANPSLQFALLFLKKETLILAIYEHTNTLTNDAFLQWNTKTQWQNGVLPQRTTHLFLFHLTRCEDYVTVGDDG